MTTLIGLAILLAYEFIGIAISSALSDDTIDSDLLLPCLIMWPLIVFVAVAVWIGDKLRKLIHK